jgi:hypothetical protein
VDRGAAYGDTMDHPVLFHESIACQLISEKVRVVVLVILNLAELTHTLV